MTRHAEIAWRNIVHSNRQTIAVSLLSLCAMALMVVGAFLGRGLKGGLTAAVEPFDMLAGYGGAYQMVLNTVFLQDYPAGNIPYRIVGELERDERVRSAIPLAFGDNYRGCRIVGTDAAIFSHTARVSDAGPWLRFAQGEAFRPDGRGAVVGSRAATELGLKIGDRFVSTHGFAQGDVEHAHAPYEVCGILESCRGPYDQAIFVSLDSVWEAHGIGDRDLGSGDSGNRQDHGHVHSGDGDDLQVTAIMVKPAGFADAYRIYAEFNNRGDAKLVFPSQIVVRLLSILGQADWLFQAFGYTAGAIAVLTITLSLYWSAASRGGEAAVLRLIGAEKRDVVGILIWEGAFSIVPGLAAGCVAGHAVLAGLAAVLERKASLHVQAGLGMTDAALALALLLAGMAGEVCAALQMTRDRDGEASETRRNASMP